MTDSLDSSSQAAGSSDEYTRFGAYYDAIYAAMGKNYAQEAEQIHQCILHNKKSGGNSLLDIGCGTGGHITFLEQNYAVEGLDISPSMLKIAQQRFPNVKFHLGDMTTFALGRQFDVITCLFSAIGYVQTVSRLDKTVQNMGRHLLPGGVLIVEPWLSPEQYHSGHVFSTQVDQPELKITRMNVSERQGNLSILNFHFLVGTPQGVEYFTEQHHLGLFSSETYLDAFKKSGLDAIHDLEGITGRGLYIGTRPLH
jgi:SAM-dependent methyltransferase